jgi:hypothetical protein
MFVALSVMILFYFLAMYIISLLNNIYAICVVNCLANVIIGIADGISFVLCGALVLKFG